MDVTKWLTKKYIIFLEKILRRKFKLRPERVEEVFASDDNTNVMVQPDIANITEEQLTQVEAAFKNIEGDVSRVETKDDGFDEILLTLKDRREKWVALMDEKKTEMQKAGPQIGDYMIVVGYSENAHRIVLFYDGHIYFDDEGDKRKVPLDWSRELSYLSKANDIGWVFCGGWPSCAYRSDEKKLLGE